MKDIIVYGAGGLGLEVKALLDNINDIEKQWNFLGFIDDQPLDSTLGGLEYLEKLTEPVNVVIAIGNPKVKQKIIGKLNNLKNIQFPNLIHPRACIMNKVTVNIEEGSIIGAGAVLTTKIQIGRHVLINLNVTIGHGSRVEEACSLMPGANLAGDVIIKQGTLIGSGANILNGIHIGKNAIVGSGAVVTKNVNDESCVIGIPAKEING